MYDKEIRMYYLIARYYNPTHGVFLSVDPDGHVAIGAGIYFVPGLGQAALLATIAVGGAYGAWYLGKKIKQRFGNKKAKKSSPLYGPKNGTKVIKNTKGEKTIRHFDGKGRVKKDVDYSNHGNPKWHPWVPHRHIWEWIGKKAKRGKNLNQ